MLSSFHVNVPMSHEEFDYLQICFLSLCERVLPAVSEKEWNFDHEQAKIAIELIAKKTAVCGKCRNPILGHFSFVDSDY